MLLKKNIYIISLFYHQKCIGINGFMDFIEKVGSSESIKTLLEICHIERIDLYEFVLA